MKVNPDTVNMHVEDLSLESMESMAMEEAQYHVQCLAERTDSAADEFSARYVFKHVLFDNIVNC
jgi:hypothetical protein